MRMVPVPGVFTPISDSRLLADCVREELRPGAAVADLCTGSGYVAITAALHGAAYVAAVDVSRRAVAAARVNSILNGARIRAVRGDLVEALPDREFDLIASNPPYVPAAADELPLRGPQRAWDAGRDGRAVIDRVCTEAGLRLRAGGSLLIVHSSVCGTAASLSALESAGLEAEVVARRRGPLGPLLTERRHMLERDGMLEPGQREEELVVLRGRRV